MFLLVERVMVRVVFSINGGSIATLATEVADGSRMAVHLALACLDPCPLVLALHQLLATIARPAQIYTLFSYICCVTAFVSLMFYIYLLLRVV